MPYRTSSGNFERASRLGQVPIVRSPFIQRKLQSYRVYERGSFSGIAENLLVPLSSLPQPDSLIRWAMAFDGSEQEVPVNEEYPSTLVDYLQIAGVLVFLERLLSQRDSIFVDPVAVRASTRESLFSDVLPSSNVVRRDSESVRDSWRVEVYELFRDYEIEEQPILDILIRLLQYSGRALANGQITLSKCSANPNCNGQNLVVPQNGGNCPNCNGVLYPTDVLRIHEEVAELKSNGTALGRLRSTLEQITMFSYLNYLYERQPRVLSSVALIIDGPLAIFGPQAPLNTAFINYLRNICSDLNRRNYKAPIIFGVEKGGQFADHAKMISDNIPRQTLMRLPDSYVFERILTTRTSFGEDTYYGRTFYYKTVRNQMLTISIPCLDANLLNRFEPDDPACYSTLPTTLFLLDQIGTQMYENALIPVALAHRYAAIPLNIGSRVLSLLAREYLA